MEENSMNRLYVIKKRNQYIIIVGVILILIVSGLCLFRDWNRRVKEPVMLPVCMEIGLDWIDQEVEEDNAQIQLFYLTDNRQENTVRRISFPERPDLHCSVNEEFEYFTDNTFIGNDSTNTWRDYGRYQIHQITVYFDQVPLEDEITLTQAELLWSNNEHTVVDIGKVVLYKNDYSQTSLKSYNSSSSTDGTSVGGMEVLDDITIESIESPLLSYVAGEFTIKINGNTYQVSELNNLYLDFKKGDYIDITINTQGSMKQKYNKYYIIDIQPRLIFKDKNGKQGYVRLYNIRESLEYKLTTENQIHQYLKEIEGENE